MFLYWYFSNNISEAHELNELNIKIMEPKIILKCFSVNFCMQLCLSVSKEIHKRLFYNIILINNTYYNK